MNAPVVGEAVPPQPLPDADTAGFWDALGRGELALCRCDTCRRWIQPPLEACPRCGHASSFEPVAGTGRVHSFIVQHRASVPGFADRLPYVIALVDIDGTDGARLPAELVGIDPDAARIGMLVRAEVVEIPGGNFRRAVFRPLDPAG